MGRAVLKRMGEWIRKHDEAVYNTRAYNIYGYGDAAFEAGHFGGQSATIDYNNSDYRFTTSKDGKSLYVYVLGLPEANTTLGVKHVFDGSGKSVKHVSLVGNKANIKYEVEGGVLNITTPDSAAMDELATVFKVEFI